MIVSDQFHHEFMRNALATHICAALCTVCKSLRTAAPVGEQQAGQFQGI
jgi:hypothetical protein